MKWSGACEGGYASGIGTATFTHNGESQSFTAVFDHGAITDGHVITSWGQGWSFDGDTVNGRFNGGGVLTTAAADRFEGLWVDGKMNGFGILTRANGERYAGDWKNDKPNGMGELRHADGTLVAGNFVDGKLAQAAASRACAADQGRRSSTDAAARTLQHRVRQEPDRRRRLRHHPDPDRRRHGAAGDAAEAGKAARARPPSPS